MSRPDDLIPLREATVLADRSLSSLRNWVRGGELSEYREEEANPGSRVMVSRAELMMLLATSKSAHPGGPRGGPTTTPATAPESPNERASLLAAVASAERDGLRALVEAQKGTIAALEARCVDLDHRAHSERIRADDYRERIGALEAELRELRTWMNLPLYRRLLTGPRPVQPALADSREGGGSDPAAAK